MSAANRRRPRSRRRLGWVLILAVVSGIAGGLVVSWWLWPVEYTDVTPDTLHPYYRAEYIVLIGHAYAHDLDLRRAQVRLAALGDLTSMGVEVVTLAEQYAAQGNRIRDTRSLARLAYALGHRRATLAPFVPGGAPTPTWTPWPTATATPSPTATDAPTSTPTSVPTAIPTETPTETTTPSPTPVVLATPTTALRLSPTQTVRGTSTVTTMPSRTPTVQGAATPTRTPDATRTPLATPTRRVTPTRRPTRAPRPTLTPTITPTPEPRFVLITQRRRCEGPLGVGAAGLLRVTVYGAEGEPLPNVELLIRWLDGEDRFFTGLKPEISVGYADYEMAAGVRYQVGIIGLKSDIADGIVADNCEDGTLASWVLVFRLRDGAR